MGTPDRVAAVRASAIGLAAHLVLVGVALGTHHGDPSWFVRFGVDTEQTILGRQLLEEVVTHPGGGHDGQFFWILARDPLLLHPRETAALLDRPVYRAQRVAYSALAAPWRLFGERSLLWALMLENVAAVAIGSYLTARLAIRLGLPARTGLAFAFNPGVVFTMMFDLCDAFALAATVGALYAALSKKRLALVLCSVLAGLSKEPAALALGAAALAAGMGEPEEGRPRLDRRTRALLIAPAALAIGAWAVYVRVRLEGSQTGTFEFAPPFLGFVRAWQTRWAVEGLIAEPVWAAALLIAACAVVILFVRRRTLLLAAALPYALMVPFWSEHVMRFTNNALRAFAPAFTFLWLEMYRRKSG